MVLSYGAVDPIDFDRDVLVRKAVTMDGQVLVSTGVTNMGAQIEDHWNIHRLIACLVVVGAMDCLCFFDHCVAYFPKHLDVFIVADRHFSNLTLDSVIIPITERSLIVNHSFKVKFGSADFGVHKTHLIRLEVPYDMLGRLRVKPNFSIGLIVDDWRRKVEDNGRVALKEPDHAVTLNFARHVLFFAENVRCLDRNVEVQVFVRIERRCWCCKQFVD